MRSATNQNRLPLNLISCSSEFRPIQLHDVSLKCRPRKTPGVWEGQDWDGILTNARGERLCFPDCPKSLPFSKNMSPILLIIGIGYEPRILSGKCIQELVKNHSSQYDASQIALPNGYFPDQGTPMECPITTCSFTVAGSASNTARA